MDMNLTRGTDIVEVRGNHTENICGHTGLIYNRVKENDLENEKYISI